MKYFQDVLTEFEPYSERGERRTSSKFKLATTTTILETDFADIRWIVPGYVPEGLTILAGRQKLGKTWLAIDWALAVATGGCAMGSIACEQGDALYIDLENGPRRIKRRLETLVSGSREDPDLSRLQWASEAPRLDSGFLDALSDWHSRVLSPRLVIIDVLQRIKPAGSARRNAYENDYAILAELQEWSTQTGVGVVMLHHTRKGGAEDPLEALSGSNGLSACADTTLVLDRGGGGISLYVRGRDVEERDTALEFDEGRWRVLGEVGEVRRSTERAEILSVLDAAGSSLSPTEISTATGRKRNTVDQLLFKMLAGGEVVKVGRGEYVHPNAAPVSGKIDKFENAQAGWKADHAQ